MKLITVDVDKEWTSCSECGYAIGFHVGLKRVGNRLSVILMCPHCSARFDTGWAIETAPSPEEEQVT